MLTMLEIRNSDKNNHPMTLVQSYKFFNLFQQTLYECKINWDMECSKLPVVSCILGSYSHVTPIDMITAIDFSADSGRLNGIQ